MTSRVLLFRVTSGGKWPTLNPVLPLAAARLREPILTRNMSLWCVLVRSCHVIQAKKTFGHQLLSKLSWSLAAKVSTVFHQLVANPPACCLILKT